LLAQLYFLYFGLPSLGIGITEYTTGLLALTLNSGAYLAEIIRAGIVSVPTGQVEAGISSGLTYVQRMRYIILPEAIGVTIQPILGQADHRAYPGQSVDDFGAVYAGGGVFNDSGVLPADLLLPEGFFQLDPKTADLQRNAVTVRRKADVGHLFRTIDA